MAHWQKTDIHSVLVRHRKACPHYADAPCACKPSFRGEVWNPETRRPDKSPVFASANEAMAWAHRHQPGAPPRFTGFWEDDAGDGAVATTIVACPMDTLLDRLRVRLKASAPGTHIRIDLIAWEGE